MKKTFRQPAAEKTRAAGHKDALTTHLVPQISRICEN
jgi:hypothetical protein